MNGWRKSKHSFANGNCAEVSAWRKSSASTGNGECAEVGTWRKSSHSESTGDCAEVGRAGTVVAMRDSKDPDGPWMLFSGDAWAAFLARLKA